MRSFGVLRGIIIAVMLACLASMAAAAETDRGVLAFGEPQSSVSLSDENIWRLVLDEPGSLRILMTADIGAALALSDSEGTWLDGSILAAGAAFDRNMAGENLPAGTYYLEIAPSTPGQEGTYELTAYFTAAGAGMPETPDDDDAPDTDAPDMQEILDWLPGIEAGRNPGDMETLPPALRLEDIIVGEWLFTLIDAITGEWYFEPIDVMISWETTGRMEFFPDGTFNFTIGDVFDSGTYQIEGSALIFNVASPLFSATHNIADVTVIGNDRLLLAFTAAGFGAEAIYHFERVPPEIAEPAADTAATEEPAAPPTVPPPTGVPTLPQTGVRNIAPLLAIIGIAGGFLLIISKELILLCQKRVRHRFMSVTYAGILIILSSATVYGLDFYEDFTRHSNNMRVNQIMRGQMAERMAEIQEDRAENTAEIPEYGEQAEYACAEPGLIEIDGELYLGILKIPALNLELPVNNEWSYERLEVSPCRFAGDFTGGLVICAHNYRVHFANLSRLAPGDEIIITDAAGREHIYIVELTEIIAGTDVSGMVDTPFELTLFTCTPDGRDRITVRSMRAPD